MRINLNQTKLIGLTMELDLKAREYKKLCNKLEKLKEANIDANSSELLELKSLFEINHNEIVEIKKQLKILKENEEVIEKQLLEHYDSSNLFKKAKKIPINGEETNMVVVEKKQNIFMKILEKIKNILNKN